MNDVEDMNIIAERYDYEISNSDLQNLEETLKSLLEEPDLPTGIVAEPAYRIVEIERTSETA
jgi:hypothetical protein